jgi:hypothetical protein
MSVDSLIYEYNLNRTCLAPLQHIAGEGSSIHCCLLVIGRAESWVVRASMARAYRASG